MKFHFQRAWLITLLVLMALVVVNCNSSRTVVPLSKGEQQVDFSFGGPGIIQFGLPMPMPLTSLNYSYGLTDQYTIHASLHTTALAFGVFQTDLGYTSFIKKNETKTAGFTYSPNLNVMFNKWEGDFRCYPQLDVNAFKYLSDKNLIYGGVSSWFALLNTKAHGEPQKQHLLPYLTIGYTHRNNSWKWGLEAKYIGPFNRTDFLVVDYISIQNHGSIGLFFTLSKTFNCKK